MTECTIIVGRVYAEQPIAGWYISSVVVLSRMDRSQEGFQASSLVEENVVVMILRPSLKCMHRAQIKNRKIGTTNYDDIEN